MSDQMKALFSCIIVFFLGMLTFGVLGICSWLKVIAQLLGYKS